MTHDFLKLLLKILVITLSERYIKNSQAIRLFPSPEIKEKIFNQKKG
jgi:hypothetical protein